MTKKVPWYGIATSATGARWVVIVLLYKNKEDAERHAQNLRDKDFSPKYVEVVEMWLPEGDVK